MAVSMCPKCDSTLFELKEGKIEHAKFKYNFIQCATCGVVVGVVDFQHVPTLVTQVSSKIR